MRLSFETTGVSVGIFCVTVESMDSPWLNFEAGAVAKELGTSRVIPYLLGVKKGDLRFPLAAFNAADANEEDTRLLVGSVNDSLPKDERLSQRALDEAFKVWWPHLAGRLEAVPAATQELPPAPSTDVQLTEIRSMLQSLMSRPAPSRFAGRRPAENEIEGSNRISRLSKEIELLKSMLGTMAHDLMNTPHDHSSYGDDPKYLFLQAELAAKQTELEGLTR